MGFLSTISRGLSAPVQRSGAMGVPAQGWIPALGSVPSSAGVRVGQSTAMTVSTVYSCVNRIAVDFARCKPSLKRRLPDGSEMLVTNHPLAPLLKRPNRAQSWFEFSSMLEAGLKLRGNAYAAIRRDRRGNPVELIPINPDCVLVLEASDGQIFYQVNRLGLWMIAMLADFPVAIPAEDMLHVRGLSFNALVGASTIGLARDAIGLAMAQEQQQTRLIANGSKPSGVLSVDRELSDAAGLRLKTSWNDFQAGLMNTGKTAVLENGVKYQSLQISSVDMELLQSRAFQVEEICRFFLMPPFKVGILAKGVGKNMPEMNQEYVSDCIAPELDAWEDKMAFAFDLHDDDLFVDFDEDNLLRADINSRYNNYRIGILTGFLKPDEARRAEKLPPEGGKADQLMAPTNMASLGSNISGAPSDNGGRPSAGNLPGPNVPTTGGVTDPDDNDTPPQG